MAGQSDKGRRRRGLEPTAGSVRPDLASITTDSLIRLAYKNNDCIPTIATTKLTESPHMNAPESLSLEQFSQNGPIYRKDYKPCEWLIPNVNIQFDLDPVLTTVTCKLTFKRNPTALQLYSNKETFNHLVLDGDADLQLAKVKVNDVELDPKQWAVSKNKLVIDRAAFDPVNQNVTTDLFTVTTVSEIDPSNNKALNGLYISGGNFFTQCEAEGFRRITWFQDRPDIMSQYSVELRAVKSVFPVLLSNGNLTEQGDLEHSATTGEARHYAKWDDPFPKPSYLFAIVAGRFEVNEKIIQRPAKNGQSARPALLQIWVKPGQLNRTQHALDSLAASIKWDRDRFGLELDLDRFMIVAVDDFNMGAMENKGLNIFNSAYVFAAPDLTTDTDYDNIEAIVGHEYFHNWTGNRVTCRDWFQLTLKEGLTVFRDQEFSSDMAAAHCTTAAEAASARAVNRIKDVTTLRRAQFAEDAGPMAHPIRPDSYEDIDNFYTSTVYEKGAEVIRMLQTIVGREGFTKGIALYFARHDGQAVTCDEFVAAIADANQIDLTQFKLWYEQAHTPIVECEWSVSGNNLTLHCKQIIREGQKPFCIPLEIGVVENTYAGQPNSSKTFLLTEMKQSFSIANSAALSKRALPSIARQFSAPIIVKVPYSNDQLSLLASHDLDPFNRWDALQSLATRAFLNQYHEDSKASACIEAVVDSLKLSLMDTKLSAAYKAELLALPQEPVLAESIASLDPARLREARLSVMTQIANHLEKHWQVLYQMHQVREPYAAEPKQVGPRALAQAVLSYWAMTGYADDAIVEQANRADNMTERFGALMASRFAAGKTRDAVFKEFKARYHHEPLAMDKWYSAQATSVRQRNGPSVLADVKLLYASSGFDRTNPNRLRSLVGAFFTSNLAEFHTTDGQGYAFWAEIITEVDQFNPQIAARLARSMDRWTNYAPAYKNLMHTTLERLHNGANLSVSTREIVSKALNAK
jgi:aminopeptidase N